MERLTKLWQGSSRRQFRAWILAFIATASTLVMILFPPTSSYATTDTGKERVLAQLILDNPNIDKSGRLVTEDLKAAARGQKGSSGHHLSETLLRLLVALGKNHTFKITALESGHTGHRPHSRHYLGLAADIGRFDGQYVSGRNAPSLAIIRILDGRMPPGSRFGQLRCGGAAPLHLPPGVEEITDSCDHLHIDVPR